MAPRLNELGADSLKIVNVARHDSKAMFIAVAAIKASSSGLGSGRCYWAHRCAMALDSLYAAEASGMSAIEKVRIKGVWTADSC